MAMVRTDLGAADHSAPTSGSGAQQDLAEATRAADFLKALSHEGRLLMLAYLCQRDHTVTELEQLTHSRQAAVSQQLARLRHEKLVTTRREGNQIVYSLSDKRVRDALLMLMEHFDLPKGKTTP